MKLFSMANNPPQLFFDPTVLILGAGASLPYGFPLGSELKAWIGGGGRDKPFDDEELVHVLLQLGHGQPAVDAFRQRLGLADESLSIDAFLESVSSEPGLVKIGKQSIAFIISRCEQRRYLDQPKHIDQRPCYAVLREALFQEWQAGRKPQVKVITFNYDRSLERYLMIPLEEDPGLLPAGVSAQEFIAQRLPIHHVYGSLGTLTDEPYGADCHYTRIDRRADSLLTIGEERQVGPPEAEGLEIDWLSDARRIAIIGFGGDAQNLTRLGLEARGPITKRTKPRHIRVGHYREHDPLFGNEIATNHPTAREDSRNESYRGPYNKEPSLPPDYAVWFETPQARILSNWGMDHPPVRHLDYSSCFDSRLTVSVSAGCSVSDPRALRGDDFPDVYTNELFAYSWKGSKEYCRPMAFLATSPTYAERMPTPMGYRHPWAVRSLAGIQYVVLDPCTQGRLPFWFEI